MSTNEATTEDARERARLQAEFSDYAKLVGVAQAKQVREQIRKSVRRAVLTRSYDPLPTPWPPMAMSMKTTGFLGCRLGLFGLSAGQSA